MKVYSKIYLVSDPFGTKEYATCQESSDIIQINSLKNSLGENKFFESDAYHLEDWCIENGFEYKCINKEYDFDELWKDQ